MAAGGAVGAAEGFVDPVFDSVGDVGGGEDVEDYGAGGDVEVEGGWWGGEVAVLGGRVRFRRGIGDWVCKVAYPRGLLCDVALLVINKLWFLSSLMSSSVGDGWTIGGAAAT